MTEATENVTIIHHLERNARRQGARAAIHDKTTGSWRRRNWREFNQLTRRFGKGLIATGFGEGDPIAILGANRPEWAISALGAMRVGGIAAGIYTSCSAEEIGYILEHSEAPIIVIENLEQLGRVLEVWDTLPNLKSAVMMEGAGESDDARVMSWETFLDSGAEVSDEDLDARLEALRPDQVADFIYTSGTTGPPKAVMLTHENLEWTARTIGGTVDLATEDVALSYLPLSHIAEQTNSLLMPLVFGYQVYFCHNGLELAQYLPEVRPTTFFGVPRVWERFESGIKGKLAEAEGPKAKIAEKAQQISARVIAMENAGQTPSGLLAAQYKAADKVVLSKIKAAIGLDRCRVFVSGAAPIPAASLEFLSGVGMTVAELYGQSEGSGPTSTNLVGANRYGTVGRAIPGVEVKIAEDGEILVRGKNLFAGYYKNQAATDETLIDGWLHSGDLGQIDDDGYLSIIGRKKDIIITSGGKNIAPQNIEEALAGIDIVGTPVVVGEQQRFLVALLTLDVEAATRFAEENGIDPSNLHESEVVRKHIENEITTKVNPQMARVEHIRNFVVLPHEFSTETGELTPTLKVKRNVVNDKYANDIAAAYESGQVL